MPRFTISPPVAYVMLCLCALFWGSNITLGRAVHADIPPIALAFWRNTVALCALLIFTRRDVVRHWPLMRTHWKLFAASGVIGFALFNAIMYTALHTTTTINAALMMSMTPVIVPLFAYFMLQEAVTARQAFGVFASLLGVMVILCRGDLDILLGLRFVAGDVIMLVAAASWSLYTVLVKLRPEPINPYVFITLSLCFAVPALLPFYLWETFTVQAVSWNAASLATILYIGLVPTTVALVLFNRALDTVGPSRAGQFQHLVPVAAAGLAILFLGERLREFHVVGTLIIAAGIWFAQRTRNP
ncbi:MAG: DMT family transporter [Rhodospirillales bacterium]